MTAGKRLETEMDVIAVMSDTLSLNEAAFAARDCSNGFNQWCRVSDVWVVLATRKAEFGSDGSATICG